ncbi:MAG: hypothetical protein KAR01_09840, partial [Desulfocapsa sp.]|nr:hypothetical protein [Desulfocapsa sp.]
KKESLHISGRVGADMWQQQINLQTVAERPGIASLWARKKIRSLMDSLALGVTKETVRTEVLKTALTHHLVSKYTSLVAVEKQISRPSEEDLAQSTLKTNLPHGWQAKQIFGGTAQTATPAQLKIVMGCLMLLAAFLLQLRSRRRRA